MKFTIVDNVTNDILRTETLANSIVDLAIAQGDDLDIVKSDFLTSLNLPSNETAYEGNYVATAYDFNGTDFVENIKTQYMPPVLRKPEDLLMSLVEQLQQSGYTLQLHQDLIVTKSQAKTAIDQAAGRARARIVSAGLLIDQEYALTEKEILAWQAAGSHANDIPPTLQTWVDATGMTPELAAADTLAVANQYVIALRAIRHIRLTGKAAVDTATDFAATAQTYINQLDAL